MGVSTQSNIKVLVVDLDLTLARTDTLVESMWLMFVANPFRFVKTMLKLRHGRAHFKNSVAQSMSFDAAELPFNTEVIDHIKAWKNRGGRVILVTASHQTIADEVGRHLNLFDRVKGSSKSMNLKGRKKAKFLCEEFGSGQFAYIGDSKADLPVWEVAHSVIAVNPSASLKLQLKNRFDNVTYLLSGESKFREFLRLLRPSQWVKNVLVLAPLAAAQSRDLTALINNALAFIIFCMVASAVYIINDAFDLQNDRNHPIKKQRPLAKGSVQISEGLALSAALLVLGLTLSFWIDIQLFWLMNLYLILNILYSAAFKKLRFVDILFLTIFYLARIVAGSITGNIDLTFVFVAFSGFLFVALGSLKRLGEIKFFSGLKNTQVSGRGYRPADEVYVKLIVVISSIISIAHLAWYINSENVLKTFKTPGFLWGIVLILSGWIIRLFVLTNRGKSQDPLSFCLQDKSSFIVAFLCIALILSATVI